MLQFPSNENGKTASIKMLSLTFRVSTLLSITHLDWGSGKVWQLFDVLTLFSNDGAHCKCRNEQVNSLRFWVSLLDINSLVLLRLGEDRTHRPPPPEHLLNFQTPTRKCQQSILWKLLNSLSVIGAYTLCLKSLVDQKRHVCPRSSKRRCYRYCPVGFLLITVQHVPKIVGCFWERAACSDWC